VVTHRVDEQPDLASGFEFVEGVDAAVERGRQIAGDGRVGIGGGASIAQQALRSGLVDELHIHVAPVILGGGRTLFGELGTHLELERGRILDSPYATHIDYRIVRGAERPAGTGAGARSGDRPLHLGPAGGWLSNGGQSVRPSVGRSTSWTSFLGARMQ
jgi:hypothetical protein